MTRIHLAGIDWLILASYFAFVLGIGFALRSRVRDSTDFFLSGRSIPTWIAGLAFLSANLGAQEMMGMAASGAKYGMAASHFYWMGAVPAMVFVGVFMMPFYYGSRARSVPEYLKLRFDGKTRAFNAVSFAVMTVLSSGISMYAMARLLNLILGWNFDLSLWASAAIVLAYVTLGGLTSAIYNEVMQFFMIVLGFAPMVLLGLRDCGGWRGLVERLDLVAAGSRNLQGQPFQAGAWVDVWRNLGSPAHNPMGVEWLGMAMGLGFVLSFGYWCTDFLVVQRAMAAKSEAAARKVPLVAALPKMLFPFLVILPGMIAIALTRKAGVTPFTLPAKGTAYDYDMTIPVLLGHYFPNGLLGLGLTALLASFMSGMAGNVTAFNTVWTCDLYQGHLAPGRSDAHYLWMGRAATVGGTLLSIAAAYLALRFNNIMDLLQLVFAFINAPLFATFLLGMFWKRTTGHGAFTGLVAGTLAAAAHHGLTALAGAPGSWPGPILHRYPSEMAQNFWTAIWAWCTCFAVTVLVSLLTRRTRTDAELEGLVFGRSLTAPGLPWHQRPAILGAVILAAALALNLAFA